MMKLWPKGIYLESSVLIKLPMDIINAEMESMKRLSAILKVHIFIPEVSFQEWTFKRKEAVKKFVERVENDSNNLSKIFDYTQKVNLGKDKHSIIEDTEIFTRKILDENKITIIETPNIQLKELLHMAVNKIKPFVEGNEKGFRDSINLFTILEHAKKQEKHSNLLIAEDGIYRDEDIKKLTGRYNVNLIVVPSIYDAISELNKFIKFATKIVDEYEEKFLRDFLKTNVDMISEYVKQNGEFTQSFLNKNYELGMAVDNIDDIKVIDIGTLTRGSLPKETNERRIKISFIAKTKFDIRVKRFPSSPEPRFKFGKEALSLQDSVLARALSWREEVLNSEIEKNILIEGTVIIRRQKSNKDEYSDLNIENIVIG